MQAVSCSFLYFNQDLLTAALQELLKRPEEARKLPLIVSAFSDAHHILAFSSLDEKATHEVSQYPLRSTCKEALKKYQQM